MSEGTSLRLLADENLLGALFKGLRRRFPGIDLVRVQDVGLSGRDDPGVLDWAAAEGRAVLTHDVRTMIRYAGERVEAGLLMPGLFVIHQDASLHRVLEDMALIIETTDGAEWMGQICYLPL